MKKIKSVKEYLLPGRQRQYVVQYEVEFDDQLSVNDIAIVTANSEYDAITSFDNNKELVDKILAGYDNPIAMNVSANACWPVEE